ncbi:MAG TPA: hypothetical protein VKH15_08610 [Candidatus Acidoferrum sp.]|nr:hypothetical protein [Candidatus Acidoferrum sp.]
MTTNAVSSGNPRGNARTLGSLWIVYAIFRLVMAILLVLFTPTATVMFGALLSRVAEPYTLMGVFHVLYIMAILVTALSGLIGLLAGLALLAGKSSARTLSLTAAFLSLWDLPLGTTLGIYTLLIFLP